MSPAVTWMCILLLCHLLALRGCFAWQSLVESTVWCYMNPNEMLPILSSFMPKPSTLENHKRSSIEVILRTDFEFAGNIWKPFVGKCNKKTLEVGFQNAPGKVSKHQLWCLETSSVPLVTGAVFASPAPPGMDETWWNHMKPIVPPMRSKKGHIKAAKINQNQIRDSTYLNMHASNIF